MRVSCNGCRVLRKGCSADCSIRPCLQWIKSPQAQANATVFLAKFYGRAGLMNLIDAGSEHLRPDIFRSLLYEACGRMVNPVYGSTGLLWSGSWHQCQAAVEAVLRGAPIPQVPCETVESALAPPLLRASAYDIRHVTKEDATDDHQKGDGATRTRVKRSQNHCFAPAPGAGAEPADAKRPRCAADLHGRVSSGNGASEPSSTSSLAGREKEKAVSVETAEASMMTSHGSAETAKADCRDDEDGELELELTLGFRPPHQRHSSRSCSSSGNSCHSRAHSPTRSSADSAAAKAARKNCDGQRMGGLSCVYR
ncbi:hypothetical protein Taro_052708 [Colocasia esculenta]|uniref:LOB domain-containing protein n=1 Tax=Colocasia esculenta TaxID=4460 RepID=A0A843XL04_COLES|nr:hypothetical protein [Colocasia esculenta]